MMHEVTHVSQYQDEHRRRWFQDVEMDLLVWFEDNDEIYGFQLCYNVPKNPHALTWDKDLGYHHNRIDGGSHGSTNLLVVDGVFKHKKISKIFHEKSREIPDEISSFVYKRLLKYRQQKEQRKDTETQRHKEEFK